MGADKGLIAYHGSPQREYLFQMLAAHCEAVYTSCRREQQVPARLNPLYDAYGIESPLNGILSAFQSRPDKVWLAVAVDMPNLNREITEYLLSHRDPKMLATCFAADDGKPEPLFTLWEKGCRLPLNDFAQAGKISPREFLMTHPVRVLAPPDASALINVNTPDEMKGVTSRR